MTGTELAPYKPPPPPIPKDLLKRNELTLRERLWVWNDVLGAGIGAIIFSIGFAWLAVPLTMAWFGNACLAIGILLVAASVAVFLRRCFSHGVAIGSANADISSVMNHGERAKLCLYDRSRRARIQRGEFQFAEKEYSIFPTFTDFNGGGRKQVTLILLEHHRPNPYPFAYLLPRRIRFSQRAWWVRVPAANNKITVLKNAGIEPVMQLGTKPDQGRLEASFDKMEELARAFEEIPHRRKVEDYEGEEMALKLRRQAPSVKTEGIRRARKMLNS